MNDKEIIEFLQVDIRMGIVKPAVKEIEDDIKT